METLYAHSSESSDWQTPEDHLSSVAHLASSFSVPFHGESWAYLLGDCHDIGKGSYEFQMRLKGAPIHVDHSTAAAQLVVQKYGPIGNLLAPLLAGHHGGLPDYSDAGGQLSSLRSRLGKKCPKYGDALKLINLPPQVNISPLKYIGDKCPSEDGRCFLIYLLEKFLYSALVDADWLDTEKAMNPAASELRKSEWPEMQELDNRFRAYMNNLVSKADDTPVNQTRNRVREYCREAASRPTGLFSMEVPTGGGKTLASLEFALNHAIRNGQERIIYAVPFTSVVEQNAQVLRKVFGDDVILEHHSNYDFGYTEGEDSCATANGSREQLLVQNWDVPVVVTTNVQFFESLFSNKPSKCRKLHNIANSVVILDEAQSLPDGLLKPTLAMLEALGVVSNTSTVLCTATQPALDGLWPFNSKPYEIIPNPVELSRGFGRRVSFETNHIAEDSYSLGELSDQIAKEHQVLCVVSSRRAAGMLFDNLQKEGEFGDELFHLSALMVPAHRSAVLDEIRNRLHEGLPCKVVSTQLVEAGVDVDFPVVLRELAGIDSILQAAGRCNREGKLPDGGRTVVFECQDFDAGRRGSSRSWLGAMRAIGKEILEDSAKNDYDPFGREGVRRYFKRRYSISAGGLDSKQIMPELTENKVAFGQTQFESIAQKYRFIEDDGIDLFIPWGDRGIKILADFEAGNRSRGLYAAMQRYSVSIPSWIFESYREYGTIRMAGDEIPTLEMGAGARKYYDEKRGLLSPDQGSLDILIK